jgi:hypothetical protein
MAPVGQACRQRVQLPHPSGTGVSAGGSGAVVTTAPSTNHDPARGSRTLAFLPNHPNPASQAASRSTRELSSAKATALQPSARSRRAMAHSPSRSGA